MVGWVFLKRIEELHPGYGFSFKLDELDEYVVLLKEGTKTKHDFAKELDNHPGIPKVEEQLKQLRFINLVHIEKNGNVQLTNWGGIYVQLKGSTRNIGREICYYELSRKNSYFKWFFDHYLPDKRKKALYEINIDDLESLAVNKWNLGKDNKEHNSLLNTLTSKDGFGSLRIFRKLGQKRLRLSPHNPKLETTAYVLIKYLKAKSLPNLPARNFQDTGFLGTLFMLNQDRITRLMNKLEEKSVVKMEKHAGIHQFQLNPIYIGKPLKYLRDNCDFIN